MAENYGALRAFNERGELNIPTQAAADYIAEHGQVTASQPQDDSWLSSVLSMNQKLGQDIDSWLSPVLSMNQKLGQGIYDVGHGLFYGARVGAENINKLIPGATWLGEQTSDAMRYIGIDDRIPEPKGIVAGVSSGIGQVLPGIIPAVKLLKAAGWAPLAADLIGGAIGDFAVSSKKDAKGIADLIGMIPGENAKDISNALNDFIQSDNVSFEDFKSRMVAALPGAVFTPVVGVLTRYAMKFKNKFASDKLLEVGVATDDLLGSMKTRWDEGKSPIPMGMSIEDVSPKQATDLDPQGFFSPMSRAVDALPQNKGTGDQMRAMIAKGEGVKAEEMAWTGLDDFLSGKKSVTKAEIKDFTDANQVRIEEVEKTSSGKTGEPENLTWDNPIVDDDFDAYGHRFEDIVYDLETGDIHDYYLEDVISRLMKANPERYPEIDPDGGSVWANKLRDYFDRGSEEKAEGTVSGLGDILRRDVNDAIDGIAKDEYMVNPYVTVSDPTGHYTIYGNDDIGYDITRQSDGSKVDDVNEIYSLEEAKIQAYTDAIDYGYIGGQLDEGDTLFSEWTLPGGENYREVLLTLPLISRSKVRPSKTASAPFVEEWDRLTLEIDNARGELNQARLENSPEYGSIMDRVNEMERARDVLHGKMAAATIAESPNRYQVDEAFFGHFNEPNVLAHIRLNDRTGPNGEKILFVEEIQSDWHQRGRKQGYKTPEVAKQIKETDEQIDDLMQRRTVVNLDLSENFNLGGTALPGGNGDRWYSRNIIENNDYKNIGRVYDNGSYYIDEDFAEANPLVAEKFTELAEISAEVGNLRQAKPKAMVQDAPLKKTWEQTALRHVIRKAAEEGYDSVAWTPGRMQADRYNLSKHIDELRAIRNDDGTFRIYGVESRTGPAGVLMEQDNVKPADLENLVGKHLAEKIRGQNKVEEAYFDTDLEVGGEGMEGFYDKELVNYANKFGKKFDAKVGVTDVNTAHSMKMNIVREDVIGVGRWQIRATEGSSPYTWKTFDTEQEAIAEMAKQKALFEGEQVWTLPITPKMRESVMKKGIPLFGAGGLAATAGMQDSNGL